MADTANIGRKSVTIEIQDAVIVRPIEEPTSLSAAEEKYQVEGRIGAGGMGEVLLVTDRDLRRQVAMKRQLESAPDTIDQRMKFVAEAQATSQLEHPGIPPVHDIGVSPEGRVYFTMKLVRGRTLAEVLRDLLLGVRAARKEYSLHRLVTILERVSEALDFAHEKGVIHRDLKPENVMLGDHGEVHVMDWGIAKVTGAPTEEDFEDSVVTEETDAGVGTIDGVVKGTIPYMSPEQAEGRVSDLDRRSDVYALGCLLYEVLTLHRAFEGGGMEGLTKVREGAFVPVVERNPRRPVPETLGALCTRAMARDPADRPQTAREFGAELRVWLDGRAEADRRRRAAEALAVRGREAAERLKELRVEAAGAEREAEAAKADYRPWQPVAEKRPLLAARERVEALRIEVALAFAETVKLLEGALLQEERNATARAELAELWRDRLADAEVRGDRAGTAYALEMMRRYDDGALAGVIRGDGSLELGVEPPDAEILLSRFVERDGVLVPEEMLSLTAAGPWPVPLPMGSYLLLLRAEGFADLPYPVYISRNRRWRGAVKMRTAEEIGEGFVLVPGGPFVYGEGLDAVTRELPDFAVARYPVTFGEYAEFLASLPEEEAARRRPQTPGDGPYMERGGDGRWRTLPIVSEGRTRERCEREYGEDFTALLPVMGVSYEDAVAYCAWRTRETGREWRLPTEEEREKAARGVDGRRFPWGELEDASLAKYRDSRDETPQPEPVGAFPTATSVYGMGDAAGNVWDWTDSFEDERRQLRVLRGGSWSNRATYLRCSFRLRIDPRFRNSNLGFRCARSL